MTVAVASLIISALALLVGGASLAWNVLNCLLTGQRAKLSVTPMKLLATGGGVGMEPVVQITVAATGRVPVEVIGWSVAFPDDHHLHSATVRAQYGNLASVHLGDDLPKVIEEGRSGTFCVPIVAIKKAAEHHGLDLTKGHVQVYFGARKTLRDRKSIAERLGSKAISSK
ncbi:hypothetical protein [Lentzea kentuckyensis]|uniref:hypothetical protein n=1 Tax=Lentzea kentuckyensis TaxID=360086 RepID=UPI00117AE43D|nr:hypothetical protein [Lentzea kentuckyensis]